MKTRGCSCPMTLTNRDTSRTAIRVMPSRLSLGIPRAFGHLGRPPRWGPVLGAPQQVDHVGIGRLSEVLVPLPHAVQLDGQAGAQEGISLIHISEPTRLLSISYAVFC